MSGRRKRAEHWKRRLTAIALLCLVPEMRAEEPSEPVADESPAASESSDTSAEDSGPWDRIEGYLRTRYVLRFTDDDHDNDLFQFGSVSVGDPQKDRYTLSFYGSVIADLDGSPSGSEHFVFSDIRNTYDKDVTAWLYHGWIDIHRLGPIEKIRLGRQFTYDTPEFAYFDGGSVETRAWDDFLGLRAIAYAGVPVHPFESSPDGDVMVGAALESRPWRGSRLRLDWMYVRDEYVSGLEEDHLLAATFRQVLFDTTNLYARWTGFADANRDVTARIHHAVPDWDLDITAAYHELFHTQRDLAIDFDRYYSVMREYRPYRQGEFRVSKLFGERFGVDAGFVVRELSLDGDESPYNHEFTRYYVYPSLRDWPVEGMDITLFGDIWDSQDDDTYSVGGEIGYELRKTLKVSVGSMWELYRFDFFDDEERDRVRTYYARVTWDVADHISVRTHYEFEHSEYDDFHTFMFDVTVRFGGGGGGG